MLELLYKLFIGHTHKYEIKYEKPIIDKNETIIGISFVQQCKICGKLKQFKEMG